MGDKPTQQEQIDEGKIERLRQKGMIEDQQNQQDVTNLITTAHTEKLIQDQEHQEEQDVHVESLERVVNGLLAGVTAVSTQVETLNERVYSKNSLDEARNKLYRTVVISSLLISLIAACLLAAVLFGNHAEANRAKDRAIEAASFRHQLADCQLPPGAILEDGFINVGKCYVDNAGRIDQILIDFKLDVLNGIRLSDDCLNLRDRNIRPQICSEINARVDDVGKNINPFTTIPKG